MNEALTDREQIWRRLVLTAPCPKDDARYFRAVLIEIEQQQQAQRRALEDAERQLDLAESEVTEYGSVEWNKGWQDGYEAGKRDENHRFIEKIQEILSHEKIGK